MSTGSTDGSNASQDFGALQLRIEKLEREPPVLNPFSGFINRDNLYLVSSLIHDVGMSDTALSQAKADGLDTYTFGGQEWVGGSELTRLIVTHGRQDFKQQLDLPF